MLDVSKLTLGEIDKIETLSGRSIDEIGGDGVPKGKMMAAIAFVIKRRQQMAEGQPPSFSWNEALDLGFDEARAILGIGDDEDDEAAAEVKAIEADLPTDGE